MCSNQTKNCESVYCLYVPWCVHACMQDLVADIYMCVDSCAFYKSIIMLIPVIGNVLLCYYTSQGSVKREGTSKREREREGVRGKDQIKKILNMV